MVANRELKLLVIINICLLLADSIMFISEQWNVIAFNLHFNNYEMIQGEIIEIIEEHGKILTYSTEVTYTYNENVYSCYFNSLEEDLEGDIIDLIVYKKNPAWVSRRNIHVLFEASLWNIFFIATLLFLPILFAYILFCIMKENHRKTDSLRTRIIVGRVKRVKIIYDDGCYCSKLICSYKWHTYKSPKVKGILNYKYGDEIEIRVNPSNYFNYDVLIGENYE